MTRTTNARIAGFTFLFYIVAGISGMVLLGRLAGAGGTSAQLTFIAEHTGLMGGIVLLTLAQFLAAVVLAVTLYALTRDVDRELALLAFCCRLTEGVLVAVSAVQGVALIKVATESVTRTGADAATTLATGETLLKLDAGFFLIPAICFAIGSTIYCSLFLRARSIPIGLAGLGVAASVLVVIVLPLQLFGFMTGLAGRLVWLPMLVFEVAFALWLITKGVAASSAPQPA